MGSRWRIGIGDSNLNLLQNNFIANDVDMILSIPPMNSSIKDSLMLHFELNAKRGVPSSEFYPRCHRCPKLMSHALWGCRDHVELVHNLNILESENIMSWATNFLDEWIIARFGVSSSLVGNSMEDTMEVSNWKPPADGVLKINTDAAKNYTNLTIGFSVIFHDRLGNVMASAAQKVKSYVLSSYYESYGVVFLWQ
ncbi:hypothetical protein Dsin_008699 [Dipteronia sinensis]|uniref:Uncharacterized protein n=1 Tax=Dipteronia sinensis TaxID=43782 RepID=A0AAE0AQ99_9ROSI|nr:hypothetical protein Dsin_008699 [Dipteronia sinensis]